MIHVMASIAFKPEHADAAAAMLVELARQSRQEAGCLGYEVFRRADQPQAFRTFEQWRDQAAIDAHMSSAHVAAAFAAAGPLLAAPPDIAPCEKIG